MDPGAARLAGPRQDEIDDRPPIDPHRRVGHAGHTSEPSTGRGKRPGGDRFGVLGAGLPQVDVHVEETRHRDGAVEVDRAGAVGRQSRRHRLEDAILAPQVTATPALPRRVHDPQIAQQK